jgi:hypothetical protein
VAWHDLVGARGRRPGERRGGSTKKWQRRHGASTEQRWLTRLLHDGKIEGGDDGGPEERQCSGSVGDKLYHPRER